jgi:hypothetical protein
LFTSDPVVGKDHNEFTTHYVNSSVGDAFTGRATDNAVNESVNTGNEKDTETIGDDANLKVIEASIETLNPPNEKDTEKVGDAANNNEAQVDIESSNTANEKEIENEKDDENDKESDAINGNVNEGTIADNDCIIPNAYIGGTTMEAAIAAHVSGEDNDVVNHNERDEEEITEGMLL